jgi:hypothetical protein
VGAEKLYLEVEIQRLVKVSSLGETLKADETNSLENLKFELKILS